MVLIKTVMHDDGLTISQGILKREITGNIGLVSGNDPIEIFRDLQKKARLIRFRDFEWAHKPNLNGLYESGYAVPHGTLWDRFFGKIAYEIAEKTIPAHGVAGDLEYQVVLSPPTLLFGSVHFPERKTKWYLPGFEQNPQDTIKNFIMEKTSDLRQALGTNYNIYTFYRSEGDKSELEVNVRFGIGPTLSPARDLHDELAAKVNASLPAFREFLR
ncbi:MAG: hypothetical protein AABX51_04995 [Nanoarchaeota archaeon]